MKRLFSMAQMGVIALGLLVVPGFAQAPDLGRDPTMPQQTDIDRDDDFNLGWLGLLGLAGLIGLRKRHTRTDIDNVRHTGTTDRI